MFCQFSEIAWVLRLNEARHTVPSKESLQKLRKVMRVGWNQVYPISVYGKDSPIFDEKAIEEDFQAKTEKFNHYLEMEKNPEVSEDMKVEISVFKKMFVGKDGKIIRAKYLGNSGFCRSGQYFGAMVDRAMGLDRGDAKVEP